MSTSASGDCGRAVPAVDPLIAIIAGGDTAEHEASIASGYHVYNELRSRFDCILVALRNGEWHLLANDSGRTATPDAAVLCTHGYPGETGELQGWLAIAGIPHCSSGVLASALAADKYRCSQYLAQVRGLRVPGQRVLTSAQLASTSADDPSWQVPFVLKPVSLGSSVGVLSVHESRGIAAALAQAERQGGAYLVEEFVDGLEITAGAVRSRELQFLLPPASVHRSGSLSTLGVGGFTDHKSAQLRIPADIPAAAAERVREDMRRIGDALDLVGFFRADFIWSGGELFFLEVNTIPGLSETSAFTLMVHAGGFTLGRLLETLVLESIEASATRGP